MARFPNERALGPGSTIYTFLRAYILRVFYSFIFTIFFFVFIFFSEYKIAFYATWYFFSAPCRFSKCVLCAHIFSPYVRRCGVRFGFVILLDGLVIFFVFRFSEIIIICEPCCDIIWYRMLLCIYYNEPFGHGCILTPIARRSRPLAGEIVPTTEFRSRMLGKVVIGQRRDL